MAITNHTRIGKGLELLKDGLRPFVEREMAAHLGSAWLSRAAQSLNRYSDWRGQESELNLDVHALLLIMWDHWNEVFKLTLGHAERSLVSELRETRNDWAHQRAFTTDDAYRALDSMGRLLTAVSAKEARELEREKQELLRLKFEEPARWERRKTAVAPIAGQPQGGLRPWREIVTPHPDVASGRYQQAEFAADLAAVHDNDTIAGDEYRDPVEFFERTYLTTGLRYLLTTALRRLSNQSGDPIVELQTNFGGGKTHAMLALYHLFSGVSPASLNGVASLLDEAGLDKAPKANRAVLVGTALTPGQPELHLDGIQTHTLWGEMAWQLGEAAGNAAAAYEMVAQTDKQGVSPGSNILRDLFARYSPCLILIDEWVAFARQLYRVDGLPAGSFEANLTFVQALTEAAKQVPGVMVVASLPASQIEIGGTGGEEALAQIRNTFGRVESAWRPATAEEGFEIVRRRLFQPIRDTALFAARDNVVHAFSRLYQDQPSEFPAACREADYSRRMTAAYPIHPELFDRLYEDWSTLEKFQRTRGVLRLMAAVIHALWERNDSSLLIMPANIPIDNMAVQSELTRYLDDNWLPVLEKDVDGAASLPLALDRDNPNLGRYSASRRVARAIYMGSAPTAKTKNPGLDERNIKLGCVQPGESVATFGDALRRLTDRATHLYVDRSRYWFSVQPSVTRLAQDRSAQLDAADVWEELSKRLRGERERGALAGVHALPASSGDVPDEDRVRLVILGPNAPHTHSPRDNSLALQMADEMLRQRGNAPRLYQNMLVFLAPDRARLQELEEALRQYLAWKSIHDERTLLNLDNFQTNQAKTKSDDADKAVNARILETYIWMLVPTQSDPRDPSTLLLDAYRLQGNDPLAVRASRRLLNEELLITEFSGVRLRMEMDKCGLWPEEDHLPVKKLWEYFSRYPYIARLRDSETLREAIAQGIGDPDWADYFAYAQAWDAERGRYQGLAAGRAAPVSLDSLSVLVRAETAVAQLARDAAERQKITPPPVISPLPDSEKTDGEGRVDPTPDPSPSLLPPVAPDKKAQRFYGVVELDALRVGRDAGKIADAVVQHLAGQMGARVRVTLEIHADLPEGADDGLIRTVTENAHTLKFADFGFEDS